jgi:hypothetical protein
MEGAHTYNPTYKMSTARIFKRQTGVVRDLGNHAESGEINFILRTGL